MRMAHAADDCRMPKSKQPQAEQHELKPEMRELILTFDAKDRREQSAKKRNGGSGQRRRRGEKPSTPVVLAHWS